MRRFLFLGLVMAGILFAVGSLNANSDTARLCRAAYVGDTDTVRRLLDSGVDPNGTVFNYQFWSGLKLKYGDIHCLDCTVKRCSPAIVQAAKGSHLSCVKVLLNGGADVRSEPGSFALYYAKRISKTGRSQFYTATAQEKREAERIVPVLMAHGAKDLQFAAPAK